MDKLILDEKNINHQKHRQDIATSEGEVAIDPVSTNAELRSANEELYKMNHAYQKKIAELTRMNNDFDHLLVHAEIGALFIDAKLRIRKITPIMLQATNLRLTDIGQPIGQVNFMDGYHDFDKDVEEAFFQDQVSEREVIDKNHMNWLVKMRPYKMENNKANGVLVILFDITKRLEAAKYELKLLTDSVPGGVARFCYDNGLVIEYANDGFFALTKMPLRESLEKYQNRYDKLIHPEDWLGFQAAIERCIKTDTLLDFEYRVFMDFVGGMEWRSIRAVVLKNGSRPILQGIITNITEQKNMRLQMKSLIDNVTGGIMRFAYDGNKIKVLYLSKRVYEIFGITEQERERKLVDGQGLSLFKEEEERILKNLDDALYQGKSSEAEYRLRKQDGSYIWLQIRGSIVSRDEHSIVCQCIINDITELKNAISALEQERERLDIIANISADALFEYDIARKTLTNSSNLNGLLGKETVIEDYRNTTIQWDSIHHEDDKVFERFCNDLENGKDAFAYEMRLRGNDGEYRWIAVAGRTMVDAEGRPYRVIGKVQDVHERKCREQELAEISKMDSLTHLYNKATTNSLIKEWCEDKGEGDSGVLLVIDIDYFKDVNDTLGHLFGDAVLCSVADELRNIFSAKSLIGRIGGDEFIVFMKDADKAKAVAKAYELCNAVRKIYVGDGAREYISCSIGLAEHRDPKISYEEVFDRADKALYYAKRSGKDCVEVFENQKKYEGDIGYKNSFNRHYFIENKTNKMSNKLHELVVFSLELFEKSNHIKSSLSMVLDRIGRYFSLDCILINKTRPNFGLDVIYTWYARGIQAEAIPGAQFTQSQWQALLKEYDTDGVANFNEISEAEIGRVTNRQYTKSCLSGAVFEMNELKGIICFGVAKSDRQWNREEFAVLRDLSAILLSQAIKWEEYVRQNEQTDKLINYDSLTGFPNFSQFKLLAEKEMNHHPTGKYAVFYTDFSNFKYINETYSYVAGDRVLYQYAQHLAKCTAVVVSSRITADNFVSLMRFDDLLSTREKHVALNKEFCRRINNQFKLSNLILVSGICALERNNRSSLAIAIDNANLARRGIKETSQTACAVFTAKMQMKLSMETEMTVNMVSALQNDEFTVYYQPKVSVLSGEINGAEALVRWMRADGTLIPPDSFIPLFEKNGFVTNVDFYVFEEVLKFLRNRLDRQQSVIPISVNFSRRHLENHEFLDKIIELMHQYQISYQLIEFELTESMFVNNTKAVKEYLNEMRQLGLSVSIDDFGSGYSSLNILASVPANVIKLDRVFLYENKQQNRELIKHLVKMLKNLNFSIVAEGVETAEQMEFLRNVGCDIAQGYFLSKPLPKLEFENLLKLKV